MKENTKTFPKKLPENTCQICMSFDILVTTMSKLTVPVHALLVLHLNQTQVHVLRQGALSCNGQQAVTLCALRTTLNQQVLPSLADRSQKLLPVCASASSHFCLFACLLSACSVYRQHLLYLSNI